MKPKYEKPYVQSLGETLPNAQGICLNGSSAQLNPPSKSCYSGLNALHGECAVGDNAHGTGCQDGKTPKFVGCKDGNVAAAPGCSAGHGPL
jgi:hypothetical protein